MESGFLKFLLFLSLIVEHSICKIKVDLSSHHLIDDQGFFRVFHGVNVAYKSFPYLPLTDQFDYTMSFSEVDAKNLKSWGQNIIRLTFYWEAIEPQRKEYSEAYLAKIIEIIKICKANDISVILDLHQDVASRHYCGEGMPDWAINLETGIRKFPYPEDLKLDYDENGYPTLKSCLQVVFGKYYLTVGVQNAFQDLYDNERGIGDDFANMWGFVAKNLKEFDNVIGYEIINEPFIGNIYDHPEILINGADGLVPFYKKVHDKIREVDSNTIVMFEDATTDTYVQSLNKIPADEKFRDRLAQSYHIYCVVAGDPTKKGECKELMEANDLLNARLRRKLGGLAGFLTEFGAISGKEGADLETMEFLLKVTDQKFISWTYWQFKYYKDFTTAARPPESQGFYDEKGNLLESKVKILSKPYAYKICGEPINTELKSGSYSIQILLNGVCSEGATFFYLSEKYYFPSGFTTKFENCPNCNLFKIEDEGYYKVNYGKHANTVINLVFTAKKENFNFPE